MTNGQTCRMTPQWTCFSSMPENLSKKWLNKWMNIKQRLKYFLFFITILSGLTGCYIQTSCPKAVKWITDKYGGNPKYFFRISSLQVQELVEMEETCHSTLLRWGSNVLESRGKIRNNGLGGEDKESKYLSLVQNYLADYEEAIQFVPVQEVEDTLAKSKLITGNPLAVFRLLSRCSKLQPLVYGGFPYKPFTEIVRTRIKRLGWPDKTQVFDVIVRILKMQQQYNVKAEDVANGKLASITWNLKLTPNECFQFGLTAFRKKYYTLAVDWLQYAGKDLQFKKSLFTRIKRTLKRVALEHNNSWDIYTHTDFHFKEKVVGMNFPKKKISQNPGFWNTTDIKFL